MISHQKTQPRRILKMGGFPGGFARQFRVQFFDNREPGWRMFASFGRRDAAGEMPQPVDRQRPRGPHDRLFGLPDGTVGCR